MSASQNTLETIPMTIKVGSSTLEVKTYDCDIDFKYTVEYQANGLYKPQSVELSFRTLDEMATLLQQIGAEVIE